MPYSVDSFFAGPEWDKDRLAITDRTMLLVITQCEKILVGAPSWVHSNWLDSSGNIIMSRLASVSAVRILDKELYPCIQAFVEREDALRQNKNPSLYQSIVDQLKSIIDRMNAYTEKMAKGLNVQVDMPIDTDYVTIPLKELTDIEESCTWMQNERRLSKEDRDDLIYMWNELVRFFSDRRKDYIIDSLRGGVSCN